MAYLDMSSYTVLYAEKKNLGEQLAEARRAAGMSQEELGEEVGASGRTVSTWETNAHLPTKRVRTTIEASFGWPVGTISHAIRTGSALPPVTERSPSLSPAADPAEPSRARVAQSVAAALELLSEQVKSLEDRLAKIEGRQPSKPRSRAAR